MFGRHAAKKEAKNFSDDPMLWLRYCCGQGVIGAFLGLMLGFFVILALPTKDSVLEGEKLTLVALAGNPGGVSGIFFLASGVVNSNPTYVYYYQSKDGSIKLGVIAAEGTPVYEEDIQIPYIVRLIKEERYDVSGMKKIILPLFFDVNSRKDGGYAFHVPKGTVKRNVNLDLNSFK